MGDSPPKLIIDQIRDMAKPVEYRELEKIEEAEENKDLLWDEGVIHHLAESNYSWNFSLVYKSSNFDIIKWKTGFAWKRDGEKPIVDKSMFVGASAGIFFIEITERIKESFGHLKRLVETFINKTRGQAPFLVYAVLENKQKIAQLKNNKKMFKNLAIVKKWTSSKGGKLRLENLTEMQMNPAYLINDYSHFILTNLEGKTNYPELEVNEVHFLDYDDLRNLKEIERSLAKQVKEGQTIDHLLSELVFEYLQMPQFQEEETLPVEEVIKPEPEDLKAKPSKIKKILEEIRKGIRRQCPKCFNKDRDKIREVLDKDNIIMQLGGGANNIYGFKYICGVCGAEWITEKEWKEE
ncbi:MAG: hypothetical protein ACOC44_09845 [Promethearchaeia archaeon]